MQSHLTPSDSAGKADARAAWLDQVIEQLSTAHRVAESLGIPGLSHRIAQAEADATRLRRR